MSEGQSLLLILGLLYFSDCFFWVKKKSIVFSAPWLKRWKIKTPSAFAGNQHGGLILLNPFPPMGKAYVGTLEPQSLSLDLMLLKKREAETNTETFKLRILNHLLFMAMFLVTPLLSITFNLTQTVLYSAPVLFTLTLLNILFYYRAHIRLYPTRKGNRIEPTLIMLLCWPMATRTADAISRDALKDFHPLAIARQLLPEATFHLWAGAYLRKLKFNPSGSKEVSHLETLLYAEGINTQQYYAPPTLFENEHSYCPRCHNTYKQTGGECPECPGITLKERKHVG